MLEVRLEKAYENFKLDIEFSNKKESLGLLGPSGSGKSLSLKAIAGIVRPDRGRIVLNGRVLFDSDQKIDLRVQDRRVGYLFQDYALVPHMTVYDNIRMGLRGRAKKARDLVMDKIQDMRLEGLEDRLPGQISGGEQQRVALARILVNEPELILLDEPFSALDDYLRWQIELDVRDVLEKLDIPAILVSHSREEIYRLCSQVCVLDQGKSQDQLPTQELFENPKTLSASILSGCKNFSKIRRLGPGRIWAEDWGIEIKISSQISDQDMIGIRSHHMDLVHEPGENTYPLVIEGLIEDISTMIILAQAGPGGKTLRIEIGKEKFGGLDLDGPIYLRIRKDKIMILR